MLRKILLTVAIMVAMPAFAGAWTLPVTVTNTTAGISAGNKATATISGVDTDVTAGTKYFYPSSTVLTVPVVIANAPNLVSVTLDNVALAIPNAASMTVNIVKGTAASHTLKIVYSSTVIPSRDINILQGSGGILSLKIGGNVTTTGFKSVPAGTSVDVIAQPNSGQKLRSLKVNGVEKLTDVVSGLDSTTPVTKTFAVDASFIPNVVSVEYAVDAFVTAILSVPRSATTGAKVTATTTAISNVSPVNYKYTTTCSGESQTGTSTSNAFEFTPTRIGECYLTVEVTAGSAVPAVESATISVLSAIDVANYDCTSCHLGSTLLLVKNYKDSVHYSRSVTCIACHTNEAHTTDPKACSGCHAAALAKPHHAPVVTECYSCHGFNGTSSHAIKPKNQIARPDDTRCRACHFEKVAAFDSSPHASNGCAWCHNSATHGVAPQSCGTCHADGSGNVAGHPVDIGGNPCASCHDSHSAAASGGMSARHFNNVTSVGYPASYMTSRSACGNCHLSTSGNATIRQQWSQSGHAATDEDHWRKYDFKTEPGCVQCHTTTGFIAYSTGRVVAPWGVASDKTKEVLACIGCHSDAATGTLRRVARIKPYAFDSYTTPDVGTSNLCMACHSGTNNGTVIIAALNSSVDFTATGFIAPHYMAAAGNLYGKAGYHFPGRTYASSALHRQAGSGDSSGPCVSCHKTPATGHTFVAQAGSACTPCHGSYLTTDKITTATTSFANALEVLRAQLAAKGFVFTPEYPHFNNVNWGTGQQGANVMGAAFNYVMLSKEPGAFAHEPAYARQLVMDSIDYLDNGTFDDSVAAAASALQSAGAISAEVAAGFTSYKNRNACTTCHGFTAGSGNPIAKDAHDNHLSGTSGLASVFGDTLSGCEFCHSYNTSTHMNGSVNLAGGACSSCHPGTAPSWSGSAPACTTCHAATPSVIMGVSAPYKPQFQVGGHGRYAGSSSCTACHNSGARHITGLLGDDKRLLLANDNSLCSSCHNGAGYPAQRRNMVTHFTSKGGVPAMRCDVCHDVHGTTNLSMIRTTIADKAITYTSRSTGWVDRVTYRGLCQVCHTLTAHYRADGTGLDHFDKDCFSCHSHNAVAGAFFPSGTCDTCHGYPPAPRNTSIAVSFGTDDNWVGAKFEDYTGGGGAHLVPAHVPKTALPGEGWSNCAVCHNGGDAAQILDHVMATPVSANIANVTVRMDTRHRFNDSLTIYTSSRRINVPGQSKSGSCFNINCHMSPSPRWSMEK